MDQNNNDSNRENISHNDSNEDSIRATILTRAKLIISSNCILLRNSVTSKRNTAEPSRSRVRCEKNNFFEHQQNRSLDGEHRNDSTNVIQSQPNREAPYYYGDIIRTRKLDATTIFQQTSNKALKNGANIVPHGNKSVKQIRQLISQVKSDNNHRQTLPIETVIVDKKHLRSQKTVSIVRGHIMDGIRVQLKNAGTRLKGAASTAQTPQKLKHHQVIRSQESHVSLRGWLYRLEGGGLKQWKRRWCVLADYCLFYYKDMAEQKLLGSALLPSFKINPCLSGDGISRKYSFKIEHSNMKTYYFAADTKEIQQQWMSALSMASIMQLSIFQTQKRPVISQQNSPDKGTDNVPAPVRTTGNAIEIDKMRMMMMMPPPPTSTTTMMMSSATTGKPMLNGEQCAGYSHSSRNNVGSTSNGTKLLYAPDGYPLSNMIDDQSRDAFPKDYSTNNANNINNNNHTETAIKYTDEVNGLPSLCHNQQAYSQQMPNHFDVPTNAFHTQGAYQSAYQFVPSYQYSGLNGTGYPLSSSMGNGVYGQLNGGGVVPPPKPRRAPAQQYYPEQQYFVGQNGTIVYDNYAGFEYNAPVYSLSQSSQAHSHLPQSVFYGDMPPNRPNFPSFIPNTYLDYSGPIIAINSDLDRPRRPHSADFLERSEDDLDCEVAFHEQTTDFSTIKNSQPNGNTHAGSVKQQLPVQPKILPTRPKSSFARYNDRDAGVELYDFPLNLPTSGRLNELSFIPQNNATVPQQFTSDDENRLNEFAESQQNHLNQQLFPKNPTQKYQRPEDGIVGNPVNGQSIPSYISSAQLAPFLPETEMPLHSPYQHHYQMTKSQLNGTNSQLIQSPNSRPTVTNEHTSAQLASVPFPSQSHLSVSHFSAPQSGAGAHLPLQNPSQIDDQLIEPHRDELYKASQLFYRRTSSIISDSAVGASTQSSLYNVQTANEDWSESGLPTTPATASQDSLIDSASRSGEESRDTLPIKLNDNVKKFENNLKNNLNIVNNNIVKSGNITAQAPTISTVTNNTNNNLNNAKIKHHQLNDIPKQNITKNNCINEHSINSSPLKAVERIDNELRLAENKLKQQNHLLSATEYKLVDQGVFDLNINDSEEPDICEELNPSAINCPTKDSSIRFKLGQKVRTYRKPRPSSSSSTASSSLPNEILSQGLSKVTDSQAPYYITDLLSEQQRRDLQKKLPSNPLPPLLSRSTVDSARQAGTTTLSLKSHTKNQDSIDSNLSSDQYAPPPPSSYSFSNSVPLPLPSRKSGNKSLDDYFGTFDSSDSDSSIGNVPVSGSELEGRRKKRTKRRSKIAQINSTAEKNDNASDSELHNRLRHRNRSTSNQRMYASAGDFIGKSRDELSVMLENYRRQQSRLSTSYDALKIAMESEAKLAELNPCKAPEYQSRIEEFQRQLDETEECVARKQPIIDRIDSLIRVSETPDLSKSDKDDNKKDNAKNPDKDDNIENLKRQQNILAVELDRVRGLLTHSTRALEAKAVENAKMEAEMQAARKKLKQVLENDKAEAEISRSEKLERELAHINQVIDNLHSRRQELNSAIENLKYPSNGGEDVNTNKFEMTTENEAQPSTQNGNNVHKSDLSSTSDSTSGSDDSSDALVVNPDDPEHSKILEQKYRAFLAANTPLIPLYENLGSNSTVIPSFLSSQQHPLFPVQLPQLSNEKDKNNDKIEQEDDENDEFFTLNLPKDVQLISSMQNQLQGCEFNPQAYHSSAGNGNMDEHMQQIYALQQQQTYYQAQQQQQQLSQAQFLQQKTEIRTVREVKREAERRKHHQAQSAKINALIRSLPGTENGQNGSSSGGGAGTGSYSQMPSHHFYMEEHQYKADSVDFVNDNSAIVKESPITAPDLIQSTIH